MLDLNEIISTLKTLTFFPSLSEENYKIIAEKCKIVDFKAGDIIFSKGEPGDFFYIIYSGEVKIFKELEGKPIATLKENEFFGEMALLTGEPRSASTVASLDTKCIALSKTDFDNLLAQTPGIALNLSKILSRRLSQTAVEEKPEEKEGKIISVYGVKDRIGTSNLACNLSLYLTKQLKKKVVLVDLDLQYGDVVFMLNVKAERTIFDISQKKSFDIELIESCLYSHPSGLKILPSPHNIEDSELIEEKDVIAIISNLKDNYDFVIIDTTPTLTPNTIAALDCSNIIFFLIISDILVLKNSKSCLDLFKKLKYKDDKIKLGLAQVSSDVDVQPPKIEELLGRKIEFNIPFDTSVHQAILKGIPLLEFKPTSTVIEGIIKSTEIFLPHGKITEKTAPSSSKLLSGILKFGKKIGGN